MADDTQGKATQRSVASGSNQRAVSRGEDAADRATATASGRKAPARKAPTAEDIAKRDPKTYRALERGYVDGKIVEEGEVFATKVDKGLWMEEVKPGSNKYGVEMASDEAGYGKKADVDYEGMSEAALQALAALVGVTKPGELGKDDLITAIKAARIPVAQ